MRTKIVSSVYALVLLISTTAFAADIFAPHVDYGTAIGPYSVAIGDVYGKGKEKRIVDIVTANYYQSNTVSALRGNGDGTFQMAANH